MFLIINRIPDSIPHVPLLICYLCGKLLSLLFCRGYYTYMKSFLLPIIVVVVVGAIGIGYWLHSSSDSVSGVSVINEALDVSAVDPYGSYQTGVGNTTLTFQVPVESLGGISIF